MKDAELKKMLSDCFEIEPSVRQRSFIRKYKRRELRFSELLFIQFRYMCFPFITLFLLLLGIIIYWAVFADDNVMLLIASAMPFLAIIALSGLGRAKRFGMDELEMVTRFSNRMIKSIRLVLVGMAGLFAIGIATVMFVICLNMPVSIAVLCCAFPYLITTYGCMILIRKWHAKENIFGCIAIATLLSLMTITKSLLYLWQMLQMSEIKGFLLMLGIILILAREIYLYLKESEELQWNLC